MNIFPISRGVNLMVSSSSIAIPLSLTAINEYGQLVLVFYVQLEDGFLSKDQLEMAVEVAICDLGLL